MTEAYAIKGPDGKVLLHTISYAEGEAWAMFTGDADTHTCVRVTVSEKPQSHCERCKNLIQQCTCHPSKPTVSEKGEADELLKAARVHIAVNSHALSAVSTEEMLARIDSYLSRGRVCEHGQGLTDYCQPCGRVNGGGNG